MILQNPRVRLVALIASIAIVGALAAVQVQAQVQAQGQVTEKKGDIVVGITNLQNIGKGQLLALLYKKVKRVEVNGVRYYRRIIVPVSSKTMTVTFPSIPFGEYAIAVMHDMDKDLKMDTNWIGIPDEDLGVSNNVKGGPLGGPKWKAAKFTHGKSVNRVTPIKIWQCYD